MTDPFISQFPEFRQIPLSKGHYAIVDAENYEWLMQWKWHAHVKKHTVYAVRHLPMVGGKQPPKISMHRQIMDTPSSLVTDHRDGNGLMNVWGNLRVCTEIQNNHNLRPRENASSRFKGVAWDSDREQWRARIMIKGKKINLGRFEDESEAASAYNEAARKYHGEFAYAKRAAP